MDPSTVKDGFDMHLDDVTRPELEMDVDEEELGQREGPMFDRPDLRHVPWTNLTHIWAQLLLMMKRRTQRRKMMMNHLTRVSWSMTLMRTA